MTVKRDCGPFKENEKFQRIRFVYDGIEVWPTSGSLSGYMYRFAMVWKPDHITYREV